jgi:hypothetical protein
MVCSAALLSTAALIAYSRPDKFPALQESLAWTQPSHHLANGLRVQVVPSGSDDLARALEMKQWNFWVTVPDSNSPLMLFRQVELRSKGKLIGYLGGKSGCLVKESRSPVMISLLPEGGSWTTADKIKYVQQNRYHTGAVGTATGYADNPFKGFSSLAWGGPQLREDGTFLLMAGGRNNSVTWSTMDQNTNDIELVLKFELQPSGRPRLVSTID